MPAPESLKQPAYSSFVMGLVFPMVAVSAMLSMTMVMPVTMMMSVAMMMPVMPSVRGTAMPRGTSMPWRTMTSMPHVPGTMPSMWARAVSAVFLVSVPISRAVVPDLVSVGIVIVATAMWVVGGCERGRGIMGWRMGRRCGPMGVYPLCNWGVGTGIYVEPKQNAKWVCLRLLISFRHTKPCNCYHTAGSILQVEVDCQDWKEDRCTLGVGATLSRKEDGRITHSRERSEI